MSLPLPTVFIPALLCDEGLYTDVITALGNQIAPQVMASPKPVLADSARDLLARAPEQFVLVGTSYGGNLALAVALMAPARVLALWLMGCDPGAPSPRSGGPDLADRLQQTPQAVTEQLAGLVVRREATAAAQTFREMAQRVGSAAGAAQARANAGRAEVNTRLGTLTMPALIVWGAEDALAPVATGRRLAEALPDARFELLEACGHLPTLEQPAASAALFADFLRARGSTFGQAGERPER